MRKRVAIIGGGVAGLSAGYYLHPTHDVELFEKSDRIGGNAFTFRTSTGESADIAAAAFAKPSYPSFFALLDELGVGSRVSPGALVSCHDLDTNRGLYYTPTLRGLRAQSFAVLHPSRVGAFAEIARWLARGARRQRDGALEGVTVARALGEFGGLSDNARTVLLSVFCLLSSMSGAEVLDAPASFFFRKLAAHPDFASFSAFYSVRVVEGHTRRYVAALAAPYLEHIRLGARIRRVSRSAEGVRVVLDDGRTSDHDYVVFACNADQALAMLDEPTRDEREVLGAFRYREGRLVVHRDLSAFPPKELMQAFTFLYTNRGGRFDTSVTGVLWFLRGISPNSNLVCTQHPNFTPRSDLVELDTVLRTPIFDFASCAQQSRLPSLNGVQRTYYCGSHFGFGLHEDAVSSALAVARALGARSPGGAGRAA